MEVIVSNVAPSTIKPSGWLFIPMTSPLTLASALSLSFFFFLSLNSLVYLEGWICSLRTWILFLIISITNQDTCTYLMQFNSCGVAPEPFTMSTSCGCAVFSDSLGEEERLGFEKRNFVLSLKIVFRRALMKRWGWGGSHEIGFVFQFIFRFSFVISREHV